MLEFAMVNCSRMVLLCSILQEMFIPKFSDLVLVAS
uniref:Uncharacterized protein n=1 Tax=Arundo donax TaxID=35708 RepID=A0A0A9HN60_ARUDO